MTFHRGRRAGFPVVPPHGFFPHYPSRGGFFGSDNGASRSFPSTTDGFASAFPDIPTPTALWPCQEDTGASSIVDIYGGVNLSPFNGANAGNLGDPLGRKAAGLTAVNSRWQAANNTLLDVALQDMTLYARYFMPGSVVQGTILEKKVSGAGTGYSLAQAATSNQVSFDADGGTSVSPGVTGDHGGQWIDAMGVVDRTAGEVRTYSTLGTAILPISTVGSMTNTLIFCFGDPSGINSKAGTLISYAIIWVGAALNQAQFNKLRGA